jgi:hypothetical protein
MSGVPVDDCPSAAAAAAAASAGDGDGTAAPAAQQNIAKGACVTGA